jgi:glycosyltransferase involved in cell wall biosynthesis
LDRDRGAGYSLPERARQIVIDTNAAQAKAASASGRRSTTDILRMSAAVSRENLTLFFVPTVFSYFPLFGKFRKIVTIHDAIAELHPNLIFPNWPERARWRAKVWLASHQADRIVTVSEHARRDISRHFHLPEQSIGIVPDCASEIFRPPDSRSRAQERALSIYGVTSPYVLHVGGFGPHKNVGALIECFAALVREPQFASLSLILIGDRVNETFYSEDRELEQLTVRLQIGSRVRFLGFVPDEALVTLYQAAEVLVLPSFSEGYGLPGIEAAACGTPVIVTSESPLAELLDGAAEVIDPSDNNSLASAIRAVVGDQKKLLQMRQAAATNCELSGWRPAARRALDIFSEEESIARSRC